jgi:hypothetical protein
MPPLAETCRPPTSPDLQEDVFEDRFSSVSRAHSRQRLHVMPAARPIHPDFQVLLDRKDPDLVALFTDVRAFVLETCPKSNEMLYHTHALTAVFSHSQKLSDAFCTIPIYTAHLNLAFNKGTLLKDPHQRLTGTGNLMRHVPVRSTADYRNAIVKALLKEAAAQALTDMEAPVRHVGTTVSKIVAK